MFPSWEKLINTTKVDQSYWTPYLQYNITLMKLACFISLKKKTKEKDQNE